MEADFQVYMLKNAFSLQNFYKFIEINCESNYMNGNTVF